MRICWAISGFSSILTLTILTAPLVARTVFSRIGPSCLHGPHQGAQKSTITGASNDPSTTSVMNVAVLTSFTGTAAAPPINASLGIALLVRFNQQHGRTLPGTQAPQASSTRRPPRAPRRQLAVARPFDDAAAAGGFIFGMDRRSAPYNRRNRRWASAP